MKSITRRDDHFILLCVQDKLHLVDIYFEEALSWDQGQLLVLAPAELVYVNKAIVLSANEDV